MASPRSAWGIDIGNRALKAVKLTRTGDGVKVDDFEFIEHQTVLSQAGDNRETLINNALATFVAHKNPKSLPVAISVAGQSSFARFVKLPPVEEKRIPEIVKFEAIQQIPFPLDDVEWSWQLFREPENPDVEVGIFAMRKELVNAYVKTFTDVGLNVQAVQTSPLAVYNAVQREGLLVDGSAMVVDVGADSTDLIIAGENHIWLRSIPIGGSSFTETLSKAFKVPFAKAEELKRTAASSKYAKQIFQAMRPVFADLVAEIQRSMGFYGSVNRDNEVNKIIALGGTFKLPALAKYLQQNLQLPVHRPDALQAGAPSDSKSAVAFGENVLSLHGAYGLALQAMGESKVSSSLLPTAIRREKLWQSKTKFFGAAAAMFALGAIIPVARYALEKISYENEVVRGVQNQNSAILRQARDLSNQWNTVQEGGAQERQIVKNINSIVEDRAMWARIYADIVKALPSPDPALAEALSKADAAAIKQTPRPSRQLFQIVELRSTYYADLTPVKTASSLISFRGAATPAVQPGFGMDPSAAPPPEGPTQRGFVVTMRLISPQGTGADLVANSVLRANLEAIGPSAATPRADYDVIKAELTSVASVGSDAAMIDRLERDYNARLEAQKGVAASGNFQGAGPGMSPGGIGEFGEFSEFGQGGFQPGGFQPGGFQPGGFGQPGFGNPGNNQPGAVESNEPFLDPITGEDMRQDRLLEVMFVIELDPPAYVPPEAPAEGAEVAVNQ